MINREAFERARRETDFVAELALGLRGLADDLEKCTDKKDLDCIEKTRMAIGMIRAKVWRVAEEAPPELRDRWRETVELRVKEFGNMAYKIRQFAGVNEWDTAYGLCMDIDDIVDKAMRDMDEALVQRYLELAGTPPSHKSSAQPLVQAQTAPPHDCPVCGDPVADGPEEYLDHIRTKHPEEWRRLETDPSYTLGHRRPRKPIPVEKTREALPW